MRVAPARGEQVGRQRDALMGELLESLDDLDRVAHQRVDGDLMIQKLVDERTVGAVLE